MRDRWKAIGGCYEAWCAGMGHGNRQLRLETSEERGDIIQLWFDVRVDGKPVTLHAQVEFRELIMGVMEPAEVGAMLAQNMKSKLARFHNELAG